MDFGLAFANTGPFATPEGARAIAGAAEGAGFESLWTVEHSTDSFRHHRGNSFGSILND